MLFIVVKARENQLSYVYVEVHTVLYLLHNQYRISSSLDYHILKAEVN